MGFLAALNDAVVGKKLRDPFPPDENPAIDKLMNLLDSMDKWIDDIPPVEQPQRFGNKAYRDWYQKLKEVI